MKDLDLDVYRAVDKYKIWFKVKTDGSSTIKKLTFEREKHAGGSGSPTLLHEIEVSGNKSLIEDSFLAKKSLNPDDKIHMTVDFSDGTSLDATKAVPSQFPNPISMNQPLELTIRFGGGERGLSIG